MTYDQLVMLVAAVEQGGFKPAAESLHVSQPSVSVAIKKLEAEFGIQLFSRAAYRPSLTEAGQSFYREAKAALQQMRHLEKVGRYLAGGAEPVVRVAVSDLCPTPFILQLLKGFFAKEEMTRLELLFEGVSGAEERVQEGQADIAIGQIIRNNDPFDTLSLGATSLVPVCAPDYPLVEVPPPLRDRELQHFVQVIVRDTSKKADQVWHGVVRSAAVAYTVNDMATKREIIVAGLGWGRLPIHLIRDDLTAGRLVDLSRRGIEAYHGTVSVIRRKDEFLGPVSERLWRYIEALINNGQVVL